MREKAALFLYNKTRIMAKPWADAGIKCVLVDIQHLEGITHDGNYILIGGDVKTILPPLYDYIFACSMSPCTNTAVSGARWFLDKGLSGLIWGLELFQRGEELCAWTGAPYFCEQPVSTIASYRGKPDHIFHPYHFTEFELGDNYSKQTCLWAGNGFVMPEKAQQADITIDDRIHKAAPLPDRADFRSATPAGFAQAVFKANYKQGDA